MKSIITYKLQTPVTFTEENIKEIERLEFKQCGENDLTSTGFSPTTDGSLVAKNVSGENTVVVYTHQEKKVNKNQVESKLKERLVKFEEMSGVTPNKDDIDSMTGEIVRSLLSQTFPNKPKHTTVVFTKEYLLIEAGSYAKAEEVVDTLRNVLGSLQATPLQTKNDPEEFLGSIIVANKSEFILGDKIVISTEDGDHKGKSSFVKGNTLDKEPARLINTGSFVDAIQLQYEEMTFTIKPDLSVSGVKFSKDLLGDVEKGDEYGSFIIKLDEIQLMLEELVNGSLGGLSE